MFFSQCVADTSLATTTTTMKMTMTMKITTKYAESLYRSLQRQTSSESRHFETLWSSLSLSLGSYPPFHLPLSFFLFFFSFTVFSDRLSSPISLALIHFSPLFPVARWPLCTRPFVRLSVRLSSLKALYTHRSVYMRCVHGTLKKAAGAIRWQLFHI